MAFEIFFLEDGLRDFFPGEGPLKFFSQFSLALPPDHLWSFPNVPLILMGMVKMPFPRGHQRLMEINHNANFDR